MINYADYGRHETRTFGELFPDVDSFVTYYHNCGIPAMLVGNGVGHEDDNVSTLYYLLTAEYFDSSIASKNEDQFKYKVMSIIFEYGPTWERRLKMQQELRALTAADIALGSKQIYNQGQNPGTTVSNDTITAIPGLNNQTISTVVRGKLEGYELLDRLLETDITREFIAKFKKLFITFVSPTNNILYREDGSIWNN